MAVARGKTYPRFGANIWWELRDEFQKVRPEVVDVPYLINRLEQSDKSARNLLPNFRALGLIDESGRPTELADLWSVDDTYARALDEMVSRAYPDVADQFPTLPDDRSTLENWFAATTGTGENSVRQMASFYMLLTAKEAVLNGHRSGKSAVNGKPAVASALSVTTEPVAVVRTASVPVEIESARESSGEPEPSTHPVSSPVLHVHLHFTADTSETQVEALMRSVRKYL